MGSHLRWVTITAVVAVTAASIVNRVLGEDSGGGDPSERAVAVSERMSSFGYRNVGRDAETQVRLGLSIDRYVYCGPGASSRTPASPGSNAASCETPVGNATQPPVGLLGGSVWVLEVWWPHDPAVYERRWADRPFTTCLVKSPAARAAVDISHDGWDARLRTVSARVWSQMSTKRWERLPADGGQQLIDVEGMYCRMPLW